MDSTRQTRRAVSRGRMHRQQRLTAATVVIVVVAIVLGVSWGGGSSGKHGGAHASAKTKAIVPGGPLAPAWAGGLAALWAPQNVVGLQPGTAAAYEAASRIPRTAGYILIADRGNNRILVVDPRGNVVFRYPNETDLARGGKLVFNDDTFVEPGGQAMIANEEDNHAIVEVRLADRSLHVLFGHPGVRGTDETHVNTPDDAYTLPDGSFTVADASNCPILFINAGRITR